MSSHSSSTYLTSLFGLHGKTTLITGGTRGIGRGLSIALASAGSNIILLSRNPTDPTVTSTIAAIHALSVTCTVYACDLSSRPSLLAVLPTILADGHTIDIVVHWGGIQPRSPAATFPDEQWDAVLNVNLTAGFTLSREIAAHWFATASTSSPSPAKKIIFISSVTTFNSSIQIPAYASTKGAITSLVRALSNEWMGKGICVNAIAPGYFETELTSGIREDGEKERHVLERVPAGRWGMPGGGEEGKGDLAGAVVWLAGRGSDFVGGATVVVDGGFVGR